MSFILQALKKQQTAEPAMPAVDVHAAMVQGSSHGSHGSQNNSFIAWGILLTSAIFGALLAGFWLGQQTNHGAPVPTAGAMQQSPAPDGSQADSRLPKKPTVAATASEPLPSSAPSKAEQYFEHPPSPEPTQATTEQQKQQSASALNAKPGNAPLNFSLRADAGVSPELLARMRSAIAETAAQPKAPEITATAEPDAANTAQVTRDIVMLAELTPALQAQIPPLHFQMHIYASDGQGWVRVNGQDVVVGGKITNDLLLEDIQPQRVVLSFRGQRFAMPALSSWH